MGSRPFKYVSSYHYVYSLTGRRTQEKQNESPQLVILVSITGYPCLCLHPESQWQTKEDIE